MAAAAELHREVRNGNNTNDVAVFFAEERGCTLLLSFLNRQLFDVNSFASQHLLIDNSLYFLQLLSSNLREVGEVKAQTVRTNIAAGLVNMGTQNLFQSSMQQMGCGMVTRDIHLACLVYSKGNSVAYSNSAFGYGTDHNNSAVRQLFGNIYSDNAGRSGNSTDIAQLAAALSMESGNIADNSNISAVSSVFNRLCVMRRIHLHNLSFGCSFVNLQLSNIDAAGVINNRTAFFIVACFTRHFTLNLQRSVEAFFIHSHACFFQDFFSQFPGEAKGIVQLEGSCTVEHGFVFSLQLFNLLVQQLAALFQSAQEAGFFHFHNLFDEVSLLYQVGVSVTEHADNNINSTGQEHLVDAQQTSVTDSTAQDAAQYIATAFVGRQNTITDHKGHAAYMVSDNLQGNVGSLVLAIFNISNLSCIFNNRENQVSFKVGRLALNNTCQTLQAGAGINVLVFQRRIGAIRHLVELGEYQVPDFQEAVAVTAGAAGRFAAAALRTEVDVDFGVRAARTAANLPPVISQAYNAVFRNTYNIVPDIKSFIILSVDGDVQLISRQAKLLSQELPAPGNNLFFEVIAKGEVAQHFKIGMVARSAANVFNITGTHAFLAGGDTSSRRFHFAGEKRLERCHACTNNQQSRVILRNQGSTRKHKMASILEKFQKLFADFVTSHVFHSSSFAPSKNNTALLRKCRSKQRLHIKKLYNFCL